jgi:hypothetical protein
MPHRGRRAERTGREEGSDPGLGGAEGRWGLGAGEHDDSKGDIMAQRAQRARLGARSPEDVRRDIVPRKRPHVDLPRLLEIR